MEIILGTAQFGLDYGITNVSGLVKPRTVKSILRFAEANGITKLDTAQAYGRSEILLQSFQNFKIMAKLSVNGIQKSFDYEEAIKQSLEKSLINLGRSTIYCVMIHDAEVISIQQIVKTVKVLELFKKEGIIKKIGVSLYNPNKLKQLLNACKLDVAQVPVNIFDKRFCSPEIKKIVLEHNIKLYARSIFLQGTLLASETPKQLVKWDSAFKHFRDFCLENRVSQLKCCLAFARSLNFVTGIVVGITAVSELKEILSEFGSPHPNLDFKHLTVKDKYLIDPSKWLS